MAATTSAIDATTTATEMMGMMAAADVTTATPPGGVCSGAAPELPVVTRTEMEARVKIGGMGIATTTAATEMDGDVPCLMLGRLTRP